MSTDIAVRTSGLGKSYGDFTAVGSIDLSIPAGSVFAMLGPNGAGKTTTVRMLATLLRPDRGSAEVFGYDVVRDATAVRSMIGLTGQYASVDETLTAAENLRLFGRLLGLSRRAAAARSDELLAEFELTAVARRSVSAFSGGMRRRLDLAATLITVPPLIFLDEPTTGLDPHTRDRMWGIVRGLVERGATVLLTTQYLEEADALADRIAVIDRGTLVAEGTAAELKASIGEQVLRLDIPDTADLRRAETLIQELTGDVPEGSSSGTLTVALPDVARGADIVAACRAAGIGLRGFAVDRPDLNEVFLSLTGHARSTDTADAA
ncbi:daunorubicin resistance protein DrrA family ABC transporter ATP-binding protein [Nocardia asteroides NBRC 15531]|uniref:ABC transporter ATP-binding protein n=1 Tax=Nocardia asteroides NBRC 15531 TaxID=1110697 RepID=U5EMP7_NOCAS|nr:daunorubicin resistance protein DrrA family ABC transporter ATP-binding protein [Nocardia asteroides]TLF67104.1 daunorubicin resistance protein DrrA family ABC transporter ATP-binding protein [Nocardia asteroides NBRC 15531]UGT51624.1 daunorubicin resistance protein DrrA family ABC transporter ATP-binding protein [Nocardia asteroides]SFM21246.1 ABC-2 type transport system ATP-binding protein [Nocardia asteroides]VEG35476.1 Daunorubicin/doxorubicin resistance ATP-binding protein DrrA [Nocardi